MIKTRHQTKTVTVVEDMTIVCDVCGDEEPMEHHDMIRVNHTAGYGSSVIGDMNNIKLDICESCFVDRFKDHMIKTDPNAPIEAVKDVTIISLNGGW